MDGKPQFSLGYLMLEVFWIALAIGLTRHIALNWNVEGMLPDELCVFAFAFIANLVVVPIALGGIVGRMRMGAFFGLGMLVILAIYPLFLPAVE